MNILWLELPFLIALAFHIAISVMLVTALGMFVLWLCQSASAPLRHAVALSVLVATLFVPGIASIFHWRIGLPKSSAAPQASTDMQPPKQVSDVGPTPLAEPASFGPDGSLTIRWRFLVGGVLAVVWITGSVVLTLRMLFGFLRQRRYLASLRPVRCTRTQQTAERLRKQIGIRRPVALFVAPQTPWPFTVGVLRPKVIFPNSLLTDIRPSQTEAVLIHELAHVHRMDCAVAMLENAVVLLFWWIPFIYKVRATLLNAREEICDAFVLSCAGDGESLAEYLVQSVERASLARLAWGVGLSADEPETIEKRITHLLSGDNSPMVRMTSIAACLIGLGPLVSAILFVQANYARAELILGTPVNLGPIVNSVELDAAPSISSDGLTLYFESKRSGSPDIYESQRYSVLSPWQPPVPIPALSNSGLPEAAPTVTADGLLMLFYGSESDIYESTRSSTSEPWGEPVNIGAPINSPHNDRHPGVSPDGLTLYFASNRENPPQTSPVDLDIYVATRPSRNSPFSEPVNLGEEVNSSPHAEAGPSVSADGLRLFFNSTRDSLSTERPFDIDLFYSDRAALDDPWGPAVKLDSLNTLAPEGGASLSADGKTLYFGRWTSDSLSSLDIFSVAIIPEPSTGMLSIAGSLLLLGFISRCKFVSLREVCDR